MTLSLRENNALMLIHTLVNSVSGLCAKYANCCSELEKITVLAQSEFDHFAQEPAWQL